MLKNAQNLLNGMPNIFFMLFFSIKEKNLQDNVKKILHILSGQIPDTEYVTG